MTIFNNVLDSILEEAVKGKVSKKEKESKLKKWGKRALVGAGVAAAVGGAAYLGYKHRNTIKNIGSAIKSEIKKKSKSIPKLGRRYGRAIKGAGSDIKKSPMSGAKKLASDVYTTHLRKKASTAKREYLHAKKSPLHHAAGAAALGVIGYAAKTAYDKRKKKQQES